MKAASGATRRFSLREAAGYGLVAAAVYLAWEVVKVPFIDRTPPSIAIRLSPTSPEVLRRAAEAELAADRTANALALSEASLARAPFNVRALRVRGLAEARSGREARANEMLTLAGNWSLRDDPAHAWLFEYRLRRGDFGSSFAHADTLARRRPDLYPSLFRLFSTAAAQEARAAPFLVRLLARTPPWRGEFLNYLNEADNGAAVAGELAIALQATDAPLTNVELQNLYRAWLSDGRVAGVEALRARLNRPAAGEPLANGDFSTDLDDQLQPFGWRLGAAPGLLTNVVEDDLREDNLAFRFEYDGFGSGAFLEQFLVLKPGAYILSGETRTETPETRSGAEWSVRCVNGGSIRLEPIPSRPTGMDWSTFRLRLQIPSEECTAQWLVLSAKADDHRTTIITWFDNLRVQAAK